MKRVQLNLALIISVILMPLTAMAQQSHEGHFRVHARVVDESKQPLPGAVAKIIGKKQGMAADLKGYIDLWVPSGDQIRISYTGMEAQVIKVTGPITKDIVLKDKGHNLDQVVVTGYSRTTKRRTTGSVAVITSEDLKQDPTANIDMLLQGKVAGVDVKSLSGRPGESARIRIRGTNTITGNASPLWVVDGVALQKDIPNIQSSQLRSGDFSTIFTDGIAGINPNDIESVNILKDASAAAIYGSRAAGGVIVITTKRGQEGALKVSFSSNLSIVTSPPRDANLMNSTEKLDFEKSLWDEFSAPRIAKDQIFPIIGAYGAIMAGKGEYAGLTDAQKAAMVESLKGHSTDWFNELFRNSVSHSHFLSLSGGSKLIDYYASVGYSKNNGLVKKTDADQSTVNLKLDMKPSSKLRLSLSGAFAMQSAGGSSMNVDPFSYAYFANPYERLYNKDGSYAADKTRFALEENSGSRIPNTPPLGFNIMREINETNSESKNYTADILASMSYKFTENFSFEGLAAIGITNNMTENINGKDTYTAWVDRPYDSNDSFSKRTYGSITQSSANNFKYNLRGQFNYFTTINTDHFISALLGSEVRRQHAKSIFTKRYGYDTLTGNANTPSLIIGNESPAGVSNQLSIINNGLSGQSIIDNAIASFYFSADYAYKNKYVASLTARTDGSNNFGSNEQFNPTGSLGLAWNIDQEEFMRPAKHIISSLSVRSAFGYTGNINRSVYPQLVMNYGNYFRKTNNDSYRIGYIKNAPNPLLRWEKTQDVKLSLDLGLFNDRLKLITEVYDRRTFDAVTSTPTVSSTGFPTQSYNTSKLLNQGLEFTLSATLIKSKDWTLTGTTNMAFNRNKLLEYNPVNNSLYVDKYVGYPLNSIFTGKIRGIDKRLGIYTYEPRPDVKLTSIEARKDAASYIYYLGTSEAPFNGGYNVSLRYRQLSLSVGGSYSAGALVLNDITPPVSYSDINRPGNKEPIPNTINDLYTYQLNTTRDATHRWTPNNPITDGRPRIIDRYGERLYLDNYMTTLNIITKASQLENVSYFKVGSLMLSYSLDKEWLKPLHLSSLTTSFTANNLLIITNYKGIDPESPGAVYPAPRTFTFGISMGL